MGKQSKTEGKTHAPRKEINNYNPYNRLELNQFHQLQRPERPKEGKIMHKKKRDLERLLQYKAKQNIVINQDKKQQLTQIAEKLDERRKEFEKNKRKEFFLATKYGQIMTVEQRKVVKKLRELGQNRIDNAEEIKKYERYLNYIKYFPKNLKYISLFPSGGLSEKAKVFQDKIIADIDATEEAKKAKMNAYEPDNKPSHKPSRKDDFFIEEYIQVPKDDQE